jgi:hypothetical protein
MAGLLLALIGMFLAHPRLLMFGGVFIIAAMVTGLFFERMADYRFTLWILIANFSALLLPDVCQRLVHGIQLLGLSTWDQGPRAPHKIAGPTRMSDSISWWAHKPTQATSS